MWDRELYRTRRRAGSRPRGKADVTRATRVFWAESVVAALAAVLAVLTAAWPDWIEGVSGFDPDHHSGSMEVGIVVALAITALLFGLLARHAWVRAVHAPSV